ncbi:hypothetical protein ACNKHU_07230 [Shigella flexneri]
MAIATQHDDGYAASRINASGRMLINGSVLFQRWANQLDMHLGRFGQVPPSAIMSMAEAEHAMNKQRLNVTSNSDLDTLALSHSTVILQATVNYGTFATLKRQA